jgi:hypothetical protein
VLNQALTNTHNPPSMLIEATPDALTERISLWLTGVPDHDPAFLQAIYAALHASADPQVRLFFAPFSRGEKER